jgi:D-arabinose 1-dehydrogenase-like Zn-dependent alcohol dehydrogenase
MLRFCARQKIAPQVETLPMDEPSVNLAVDRLRANQVRYRAVLVR